MVNLLYAVAALTCALVTFILPLRIRKKLNTGSRVEKSFLLLVSWNALFCVVDSIWGMAASSLIMNDTFLFIISIGFHLSAAITPAVWLDFVLAYLGNVRREKLFRVITYVIFLAELVLIIINIFNKMMFYVAPDGTYATTAVRKLLFYLQYTTYVAIAVVSVINFFREKIQLSSGKENVKIHNHKAVLIFVAAPIICGVFQMIYPDAPAYSIGYTLGICVIYSTILTDMLHQQMLESARAEASNAAKTAFLFNMSHDIRTPMNAIIGFTNIGLTHAEDSARVKDSLEKIKISSEHLLNLINDILEMSRIEAGKLELSQEPTDLMHMLKAIDQMNHSLALSKSIDYTTNIESIDNRYVYTDELHINEVIINLTSNAIKYTKDGGKVSLTARQISAPADGVATYLFEIKDTGIGISKEFQEHLFESFSRENSSTVSRQQGAGLGLSIVKKITDLAGGTIEVDSTLGEGSTFTVRLPLKVMDEEAACRFVTDGQDESSANIAAALAGTRVLLVDDNELNRELATDILTAAGFQVETASDGELAVKAVKEKEFFYYDFILMDIQMPVMDGYEATAAIRALPGGESLSIIALSANAFKEDIQKSLDAGMNAHVAKPIDVRTLLSTMYSLKN